MPLNTFEFGDQIIKRFGSVFNLDTISAPEQLHKVIFGLSNSSPVLLSKASLEAAVVLVGGGGTLSFGSDPDDFIIPFNSTSQ